MIDEIIGLKLLPESFRTYRETLIGVFDIETLQSSRETDDTNSLVYEAIQIPVSIGFDSNIPGIEARFFVRSSSDPDDGYKMVKEFLDYLQSAQEEYLKNIPKEILDAKEKLSIMLKSKFCRTRAKLQSYDKLLKKLTQFNVFGYNSSRYDLPGTRNHSFFEV